MLATAPEDGCQTLCSACAQGGHDALGWGRGKGKGKEVVEEEKKVERQKISPAVHKSHGRTPGTAQCVFGLEGPSINKQKIRMARGSRWEFGWAFHCTGPMSAERTEALDVYFASTLVYPGVRHVFSHRRFAS